MKSLSYILFLFTILSISIKEILAINKYYIVSIQRNETDKSYDEETEHIQTAIDDIVNERMNDIYNIIINNKETYVLENGVMDEKLNELNVLNKRSKDKIGRKYSFVNKNRPVINIKPNSADNNIVTLESDLVSHICPITNYYAIKAYLSDPLVEMVEHLDNIISVTEAKKLERPKYTIEHSISKHILKRSSSKPYYDLDYIKKETGWKSVSVQENAEPHLAVLSQYNFNDKLANNFDYNYYYPTSAGKGIDIYLIDEGIYVNHEDFNTYKGKSNERTITCDATIADGKLKLTKGSSKKSCSFDGEYQDHGTMVASVAAGSIFGVAKNANIHMLATDFFDYDFAVALDYVKTHGKPHKSIISVSRNGVDVIDKAVQHKINELTDSGFIVFASSGNDNENACDKEFVNKYAGYDNVLTVGATFNDKGSIDEAYTAAYYSNFGDCVDIQAPGYIVAADFFDCNLSSSDICTSSSASEGTSFSTPIVAGLAALIMGENSSKEYNYKSLKKEIIELSNKNIIKNLDPDTPNRFANNGKRVVYSPDREYDGCGVLAGNSKCSSGCCSKDGYCINPNKDSKNLCKLENGCQSEFGKCNSQSTVVSPINSNALTLDNIKKSIKTSKSFENTFLYK